MTERRKSLIRILMFVARLVNDDVEITEELKTLTTHLAVWAK